MVLLLQIVVMLLQIALRSFELPVGQAKNYGKPDKNNELEPGKFSLHFSLHCIDNLDCVRGRADFTLFNMRRIAEAE